mgnify:CR=1 FL=1
MGGNIAVFGLGPAGERRRGPVFGGAIGSDRFWRRIPVGKQSAKVLGIHVIRDGTHGSGLPQGS